MIVRIECLPSIQSERLYDLCDGSLSTEPVGMIQGDRPLYSAEALLCDIGEYDIGNEIRIIVTGFTDDDIEYPESEEPTNWRGW